jgi:hypothetical protein
MKPAITHNSGYCTLGASIENNSVLFLIQNLKKNKNINVNGGKNVKIEEGNLD